MTGRSLLQQFKQQPTRTQVMLLAAAAFIIVFILWQVSSQTNLLYPVRLFVTFVHESGHGLTAILTGGRFNHFEVFDNGAGIAYTSGGSPFLVPQMGYLGAAFFGAVLLYAANRARRVDLVSDAVGLYIAGCAILFTGSASTVLLVGSVVAVFLWMLADRVKESADKIRALAGVTVVITLILVRGELALIVGLVSGALLIALGTFTSRAVTIFVLNMLAFLTGFNAINDVWSLMGNVSASLGATPNDALATANYTHTPVQLWIILWTGLAIIMMSGAVYLALIRPARLSWRQLGVTR